MFPSLAHRLASPQATRATLFALLGGLSLHAVAASNDGLIAQSFTADAAFSSAGFGSAYAAIAQAMQPIAVAAPTSASTTNCPFGGNITYSVAMTSASASSTALPIYTVQFNQCAISSAVSLQGSYIKTVTQLGSTAATKANGWVGTTQEEAQNRYDQVTVSLPAGTLLLTGSDETRSSTTRAVLTKVNTSKVEHFITDSAGVSLSTSHAFNDRASAYALVPMTDITYTTTSTAGATTQASVSGQATLAVSPYQLAQIGQVGPLTFVLKFVDTVNLEAGGALNSGAFTLLTPASTLYMVAIGGGQATVCVDKGNDGTTEACFGPFPAAGSAQ